MINGPCRGGGLAIALACDLRYASDTATFAAPPAKLGIAFPHPAVTSLAKTVGDAHARHLLLTASTINAKEAHRIGLIHHVTTNSALPTAIDDLTAQISQLAPQSLTAAKVSLATINGARNKHRRTKRNTKMLKATITLKESPPSSKERSPDFNGT